MVYVRDDGLSLSVHSEDQMRLRSGVREKFCVRHNNKLWLFMDLAKGDRVCVWVPFRSMSSMSCG